MTANQIVRVIPVLKVNNRNVNQRFYEETLGMKVLVEEGALYLRRCLKSRENCLRRVTEYAFA